MIKNDLELAIERLGNNDDFKRFVHYMRVERLRALENLAYSLSSSDKDYSIQGKIMAFDQLLNLFPKAE